MSGPDFSMYLHHALLQTTYQGIKAPAALYSLLSPSESLLYPECHFPMNSMNFTNLINSQFGPCQRLA